MRKERGITLVSLVVTIIVLIILAGVSINLLLGENGIITKAKEAKRAQEIAEIKEKLSLEIAAAETDAIIRNENLEQRQLEDIVNKYGTLQEDKDTIITKKNNYEISLKEIWYGVLSESGSYTDKVKQIEILEKELAELKAKYEELEQINEGNTQILEDLRNQIARLGEEKRILEENLAKEQDKTRQQEEKIAELNDIKTKLANVTVTEDKILKDYIAYKDGELITGTMTDNGALNATLNAGGSYTIPAGYTTGGKVTANSLASQTQATATADNITEGKTAWVNGELITGNLNISSGNISIIAAQTTYKASNGYSTITLSKDVSEGGKYYAFWTGASGGGAVYPASITITGGTYKALASYTSTTSSTNKNISANVLYEINITDSGNIYFYSSTGWNAAMCCIIFKIV